MQSKMVVLIRSVHGLITVYFLSCIGLIYFFAFTNAHSVLAWVAVASIVVEGVVVSLNHGDCPLGKLHNQFGDQKAFFELFVPSAVAKRAVPFFGLVSAVGILALLWNYLQVR